MGNCCKHTRTPVHSIHDGPPSRPPDDDLPYMLVLNNYVQPQNQEQGSLRWWHRTLRRRRMRRRHYPRSSSREAPPTLSYCVLTEEELDKHIIETLSVLRNSAENDASLILRMRMFRYWANGETGWKMVLSSLIRAVPLDDVLGPSAITLFIDHCPLPTKQAVMMFIADLNLSESKANDEFKYSRTTIKSARHRNVCAVLGHLAETLAGPLSGSMLVKPVLDYFLAGLNSGKAPLINILYSLIALEKFAQTGENKKKINRTDIRDKLLLLEEWSDSPDYKKRQIGFSSRWLLDNTFIVEDRVPTYQAINLDRVNAMLNCNDVSEYLKISADGLEARSDASSFESVRCTFSVNDGAWYYEVTIVTPGVMQIGWATRESKFFNHDGYGIGDDEYSCAYDGCRQLYWYCAASRKHSHPPWKEGDVLGLLLDVDSSEVIFYLNGDPLPPEHELFVTARSGYFAAASFMSHQQCIFNFGANPFKFPPKDRSFSCFNDHGDLSNAEKLVLPKYKKIELIQESGVDECACTLCCDLKADTILHPCGHGGICHRCAEQLSSCPLCRGDITGKSEDEDD